jgi:single-stranded DNA-binding protein
MKGTNTWTGSGNVASDVLYGETKTGDKACNFKLAIEQSHKSLVFVRINAYAGNVEVCQARRLKKGDYVVVEGELMNRRGQDDTVTEIRCKTIVIPPRSDRRENEDGSQESGSE